MKIKINETYYIEFNGDSYTPFKYKLGGKNKQGKFVAPKWENSYKYFMSLEQALKWVVVDSLDSEFEEIDLGAYISFYSSKMEELKKVCEGIR